MFPPLIGFSMYRARQVPREEWHCSCELLRSTTEQGAVWGGSLMDRVARDVMTPNPAACTPTMTLDEVAKLMVHNDCGEIPIVDGSDQPVGVITDRDIVC